MKSAIIIDFTTHLNQQNTPSELQNNEDSSCSDELAAAIQTLILQMRKAYPLKQTG